MALCYSKLVAIHTLDMYSYKLLLLLFVFCTSLINFVVDNHSIESQCFYLSVVLLGHCLYILQPAS